MCYFILYLIYGYWKIVNVNFIIILLNDDTKKIIINKINICQLLILFNEHN